MGCNLSTPASAPLPAELEAATREYFGLGEVPLTLKAVASGSALQVKAAGLDRDDLLMVLESGFYSRGYWIAEATVHVDSGLFLATFELCDTKFEITDDATSKEATSRKCNSVDVIELDAPHNARPASTRSDNSAPEQFAESLSRLHMKSMTAGAGARTSMRIIAETQDLKQLEAADRHAVKRGAAVRLTLMRDWAPGLRLAMEKTIRVSGFHMIMARFSMARNSSTRVVKDTFWLTHSFEGNNARSSVIDTSKLPQWLQDLSQTLQTSNARTSMVSDPSALAAADVELQVKQMAMVHEQDKHLQLPAELQEKASTLHYKLETAPWGLKFDNLEKFSGSGISDHHTGGEHVLEFATYYAQAREKSSTEAPSSPWSFAALVNSLKVREVAEFVTQYSLARNCLTIQKAFLNGVLPSGQRAGARVAAEQLLHMPVSGDTKWDGLAAVRSLRKLHLFDVVNWNTYALMSAAVEDKSKTQRTETEKLILQAEAKCAGLTLAELTSKPLTELFVKTALGKLVKGVLSIWREGEVADHVINNVAVRFSTQHELILGEPRLMMDIDIELKQGSAVKEASTVLGG